MEIRKVLALRGPNVWAHFTVLEAWVDLKDLKDVSSEAIPGFNDRLMSWLPSMIEHRCSVGERGGFFERLRRGTYMAHILEHVTLELQSQAGTTVHFGRARATSEEGVYKVVVRYREEELARACLNIALELCLAAIHNRPFDVQGEIHKLRELAHKVCLGPSTAAIVKAARSRGIPYRRLNEGSLVQLGYGARQRRILTAETDQTSAIAESIAQDKDLTRKLLAEVGVPVPEGRPVSDVDDALVAAREIDGAIVVKPQYGNQGRGVTTNISTPEQIRAAHKSAREEGREIIVERYAPGDDHRLLVVGNRVVAAARREPAQVIGDGKSTIRALVERVNSDPRRSDGHATSLSFIPLDAISLSVLAEQGCTPESVTPAGQRVLIRRNANLSTGGTAVDVTDSVHPEVAARAIDAARAIGLDIAGVDVVVEDIGRPLEEQGGVIVEVNAGPGLRMHLDPSLGTPRPVGEAIIDMLFPEDQTGRIPIVAVTGTNGKTTTTRLIAHMLEEAGRTVGFTCTDGIYVDGRRVDHGDCAGPKSARAVLLNPKVEAAVFETARGGIVREGLGFDRCDVAVVTNIGEGDHLGLADIDTPEQLAKVKRAIVDCITEEGAAVLNANDPLTAAMAEYSSGGVIFFARDAKHPVIETHRANGGRCVFVREGSIVRAEGPVETVQIGLDNVPLTRGGQIGFQVENVLAAVAAAWSLGLDEAAVRTALETFCGKADQAPGRFNVLQGSGATLVLDYGHNTSALSALVEALDSIPHERRTTVYTVAGDRRDEDMVAQGRILADSFDHVIVYEDQCTRGRTDGEVIALMRQGLEQGKRVSKITEIRGEFPAFELALKELRPGDLVVLQADRIDKCVDFVQEYFQSHLLKRETTMTERTVPPIVVRDGRLGKSVYATRTLEKGELVHSGWGPIVPERTRYSMQVDLDTHMVADNEIRFINHSCDPNCGLLVRRDEQLLEVHPLRRIEAGEELTFDYATFEYEIQFMLGPCLCGSSKCRGKIKGFKELPVDRREAYGPYVAEYLLELDAVVSRAG